MHTPHMIVPGGLLIMNKRQSVRRMPATSVEHRPSAGAAMYAVRLATVDAVSLYLTFVLAYQVRALNPKPTLQFVSFGTYCLVAAGLALATLMVFGTCGLYSTRRSFGRISELGRVVVAVAFGVMAMIVADYLTAEVALFSGRSVPLYAMAIGIVLVMLGRQLLRWTVQRAHARGRGLHNTVLVGIGPLAERIAQDLLRSGRGNQIVAVVSPDAAGLTLGSIPVYSSVEAVLDERHLQVDEILHADPERDRAEAVALMTLAADRGLGYRFVPDMYGVFAAGARMSAIAGVPVMEVRLTSLDGWAAVGKRAIDIVGATTGLFLLAPLLLIVAATVKITDPSGPVLYRQERLGRGGRPIGLFKFRSMLWEYSTGPDRPYKTAEQAFTAMGRTDLVAEFAHEQKVADDPRVSRFGLFLRRTSLDELPQLINTLLGHISLVGPRPITRMELERYGQHRASFLALKPGITGLWQVSGRSDLGYDQRVKLDVHYVENWSAWLDISIFARTFAVVAARRGAY